MIYLSTGGFNFQSGYESAISFFQNDIGKIELSGGQHDENFFHNLSSLPSSCNLQIHNYFPPPKNPFVFNLASTNDEIATTSLNHAYLAIDLAHTLECGFYSFHAGFLLDPKIDELGHKFRIKDFTDRKIAKALFIERVGVLSSYAKKKGIKVLIENNVFSEANSKTFASNPFLMTDHLESIEIMNKTDENVELLVDVGHLKVSSHSEGFSKSEFLESTADFTCAYHLSENDSLSDSNDLLHEDSWFWPYLRKDLNYYSLEVYTQEFDVLKQQIDLTRLMLTI
jgi:hypothetical protein